MNKMKLTEILDRGERNVQTIYTMPQREYENNESVRSFRLISRAGGAICFTLSACVMPFIPTDAPLSAWAIFSYMLVDGIGDLVSGRHHYLPMKAYMYACNKLRDYLKSKTDINPNP